MTDGKATKKVKKSPAMVDRSSTSEKSKDELWEECCKLQKEVEREHKQKKSIMIETNKAQRRWHISKKHLEETKARIREKLWLKQDAQRRQLAEVQECQQKLIQLETSQHNVICELKLDTIAKTSKTQKEYVESEVELQGKTHLLQVDKREKQSCTGILMRNLKQKQDNELTELKESYKQRASEMEANYDQKVEIMVNEYRTKSISEIQQIDLRMVNRIRSIVMEHEKAWQNLNRVIIMTNLDKFNKDNIEKHLEFEKKKLKQLNSRIATAVQKNKHLRESLQTMEEVSKKSYQELVDKRRSMAQTLKRDKNITVRILEESRDLSFKQQQLESEYAQVEQDYEELKRKHTEATLAKQQKSELRALVLKRQVKAMEEIKERDQLKLWVALAFGQGDKTATENIKELFESKDTTNKDLKDDFYQELQEYEALVTKAKALGISVDKSFHRSEIKDPIRKASPYRELRALCISKDSSDQKEALGLKPAGADSAQ
ncbi:hypothetical protein Q8A73_012189 [Channa argus]|nr:hypothetical protein Q8A73_012189 [Channa argus]